MKHVDLFSGIGGFALAAKMVGGIETTHFCEIDPWCRSVLNKNFPTIPIQNDIREFNLPEDTQVDLITGGYPCQPFSVAGNQKAEEDPRHLWPPMLRVIAQRRPTWVVCENVLGHITLGLDKVLHDLEGEGYSARPFVLPALSAGLNHNRGRVYVVAHSPSNGLNEVSPLGCNGQTHERTPKRSEQNRHNEGCCGVRSSMDWRSYSSGRGGVESTAIRVDDGLPHRMDRNRGLGNAIAPSVAAELLYHIKTNTP